MSGEAIKVRIMVGDRVLGTIEKRNEHRFVCRVRRTAAYASSWLDAIRLLRKLSSMLDKRCDAA